METKRYEISFEYRDEYSHGNWNSQSCSLYATSESEAIRKCKELYGLDECECRNIVAKGVD